MKLIKATAFILFFTGIGTVCFGQMLQTSAYTPFHFEEPCDVRRQLADYILSSAYIGRHAPEQIVFSDRTDTNVEFKIIESDNFFYQVLVPQYNGVYPLYSKGTYIIKRQIENGEYVQVKVFLKSEASCFARIFPRDDRSVLQVYLYGSKIGDDIILPVAFEDILFFPFDEIVGLTKNKLPWDIVWPEQSPLHDSVRLMTERIEPHLSVLQDEDDGALNSEGVFVYIETGERQNAGGFNCSGFAKWVADGIYRKTHDSLLDIEALKQKHIGERGNSFSIKYEDERDPYFGLDWTRNIASALIDGDYEAADVRDAPFHKYTEDVGYRVKELQGLLYQLAVRDPGRFYLGSVNLEFGSDPKLWQHVHVVVIFPYLTSDGRLTVKVMERNVETSLESLIERYPDGFIHLVYIEAEADYRPFEIVTRLE